MLQKKTIKWLSDQQHFLDSKIVEKHKLVLNKDMLKKKIIAFWVELGEYANEEKSFKYWKQGDAGTRGIQLEEYIDGLHFIISIGNQVKFNFDDFAFISSKMTNNIDCYFAIIEKTTKFVENQNDETFLDLLNAFLQIAVVQNMSEDELIVTYQAKHKKNQERQVDNY